MHAAEKGYVSEVVRLLGEGVPIDIVDGNGFTAFLIAVQFNRTDFIKELLQRGANVNHQNHWDRTALHESAIENNTDVIRLLLQYGASTTKEDSEGRTPIECAEAYNHEEAVRLMQH